MFPIFTRLKHVNFYLFEAFLMFRFVSQSISFIAINLLIQDKICMLEFEQNATYCQNIQLESNTAAGKLLQTQVLSEATTFNLYKNVLECIPMFVWSLFVGSFLDRHPTGTTFLLFSNVSGSILTYIIYILNVHLHYGSVYFLLIGSGPILFTGGITTLLVVGFRYITVNTAENDRSYKFVILEIIFVTAFSGAGYFGGQLLQLCQISDPTDFVIRTYNRNFFISLLLDFFSIFLLYLLRKTEKSRLEEKMQLEKIIQDEIQALLRDDTSPSNDNTANTSQNTSQTVARSSLSNLQPSYGSIALNSTFEGQETIDEIISKGRMRHLFKILFDFNNLRQTVLCFSKSRPNRIRMQIFILYFVLFLQLLTTQGMASVFLQFSEKVYHWDSERYSTLNALSQIISMSLLALGTLVFIRWLKWVDETLIILSLISTFLRLLLIGSYLSEVAFFVSLFVGFLSGFTVVTVRTKISKIVPEEEIGKIFSLSSSMESLVPLVGSLIFSNLFTLTIYSYPGFIYQFAAILILISLGLTVIEEVYCPVKSYHDLMDSNQLRQRFSDSISSVQDSNSDTRTIQISTTVHQSPSKQKASSKQKTPSKQQSSSKELSSNTANTIQVHSNSKQDDFSRVDSITSLPDKSNIRSISPKGLSKQKSKNFNQNDTVSSEDDDSNNEEK